MDHRPRLDRQRAEYAAYRGSPEWAAVRQRALRRDGFACRCCGATADLHVHHLTYAKVGNERPSDLITLCGGCHDRVHAMRRKWHVTTAKATVLVLRAAEERW